MTKDFLDLEKLVAKIQAQLAPNAEILHDQKLDGRKSGRKRQIDVLVRDRIGQYEIMIVIDCKDYKKPADVKSVEEFYGLCDDVGAQKGVLVCPTGFSAAAKTRADGLQIDLYSPVDTDEHKWKLSPEIPAFVDFRSAAISFGIRSSSPYPFMMPQNFFEALCAYDEADNKLGTPLEVATRKWNDGIFPDDVGFHKDVNIFDHDITLVDNGYGKKIPVELYCGLHIRAEYYFGMFPITRISGFKDEIRGGVITNAFEVGILSPEEVSETWKKVNALEDAPVSPVIGLTGRVAWLE